MRLGVTFVRLTPVLSTWRQSLKAEKKRSGKLDFVWRDAMSPLTSCKYHGLPTVERDGEVWQGVMEILLRFLLVSRFFVWRCRCLSRSCSVAWHWENVDPGMYIWTVSLNFKNFSCNSISFQKNVLRLGFGLCSNLLRTHVSLLSFPLDYFVIIWFHFCSQVLEVVAGSRGEDVHSLAETVYENTLKLFFR